VNSASGLWIANALVNFGVLATISVGLNISFGMAGILDLSYFFSVAIGAYFGGVLALGGTNAALDLNHILGLSLPWPIAILGGAVASGLLGLLVGLVALRRLRSDYLAIVLFAVWSIGYDIISNTPSLFNGITGLFNVPQPFGATSNPLTYPWVFLPIVAVVLGLLVLVAYALERSGFGRTVRSVRDDSDLAEAMGKAVMSVRIRSMVVGCAYAGVAGALTIFYVGAYNPSAWFIFETIAAFAAVLIGGRGNVFGALIGAFIINGIASGVQFIPTIAGRLDLTADFREALLALVLMLVLYIRPHGVFRERLGTRTRDETTADELSIESQPPLPIESVQ